MHLAFVATRIPRKCGIATFTGDLMAAMQVADRSLITSYVAIDEPDSVRAYGREVVFRIRQGDEQSYREAAQVLNRSGVDAVNVQHEFGLYGTHGDGSYHDHLTPFLEELRKPVLTTLHTVLPEPERWMRDVVRSIADLSSEVVVMVETAANLLGTVYGVQHRPTVVPHGMPAIEPKGRHAFKRQLDVEGRELITTFGLVDPRKGLEYVIDAMPAIVARHPNALYLIAGETHPELLRRDGEAYRNQLVERIQAQGLTHHVKFLNQYLTSRQVVDYLLASDVYVTPYLDPNQITSGTLAYALGAGKAIVSTRYLHAVEALADERGILCDFRDSKALGDGIERLLSDSELKQRYEQNAYRYGKDMAWPYVGARLLDLMGGLRMPVPRTLGEPSTDPSGAKRIA